MRVNIHAITALLLLTAPCAFAQADAPAAAPSAAPATPPATAPTPVHDKDDDVYCRTVTTSGSYVQTRVCHTQREWKVITEQSQKTVNRMTTGNGMGTALLGH